MSRLEQRKSRLRAEYGFDFPDDFFRFWEFCNRLAPLDPLHALAEVLDVVLVGPFEVLAGRFDGRVTRHSLLLHWRYHDDPPEFFTVLAGSGDGLHWGYYLDDLDSGLGCVASYFASDAYELSVEGDTLFEAMRLHLEFHVSDCEDHIQVGGDPGEVEEGLEKATDFRQKLCQYATADRTEIGSAYTERYAGLSARNDHVVADTLEGMGIVVPERTYRPLSLADKALWRELRRQRDPAALVEEARQALIEGFPGTALELGRNLWATVGKRRQQYAFELLDAAYAGLERTTLRRVLQTHHANRRLPSVDILENEERPGGE